jgi:tRNA nucleotidyltransferase (CCA-adding enzyme)
MRIILTHEQADFDAVASLLGAYLLDESALSVLPRRMNRNVRAFITLYGAELPFIDPRDLPKESIKSICLVDTQSMATPKGMSLDTKVHVVDHHPLRNDLPREWTIITDEIGATASLLVECLQERNRELSLIHSTLLLLGIYEDTGSLTYSRTTSRDLRAASYLLEQGAILNIAADFLNHPLSTQQQILYDSLRTNALSYDIHGYTVIIATGDAQHMDEELSTIAHKLRDLLDPDALFLLITTRGGVQMIGRSTCDNINVSEIAGHFGGGGHSRAAASLLKDRKVDAVKEELVEMLPTHVHPAVTVSQIMSRGPQVISPQKTVSEVAERMQRYGYEGYPVVEGGRVVGLITRRAVDRAISHKLNLTASSLMEAGEVIVHPRDSIDHLQRLMTETGWGQIPVVDPQTNDIIGIVTRTDLLKTLTTRPSDARHRMLTDRLERALPSTRLALLKTVAEKSSSHQYALYIVGGFVRDLLLDRPGLDFDFVVEGDAIHLARILSDQYGGRLTTHARFGTAKWLIAEIRDKLSADLGFPGNAGDLPEFLDFITARTEFYTHPTALPTVELGSIKLDLHRRDFTINTLALRLDGHHYGQLHDYWGGLTDIRNKQVRVLHSLSFVDDPTRMLRAVRFEQRFGFEIEERTLELLCEAISLLGRVSGDRIRHELDRIVDEENNVHMFDRMDELKLLSAIIPGIKWGNWVRERFQLVKESDPGSDWNLPIFKGRVPIRRALTYALLMMRLPVKRVKSILTRLKFSRSLVSDIIYACNLWSDLPSVTGSTPSIIVERLDDVPLISIYANYLATDYEHSKDILYNYATIWCDVMPTINGHDLRALGVSPGPTYKEILGKLRAAWLDGSINSIDQERELLEKLISQEG